MGIRMGKSKVSTLTVTSCFQAELEFSQLMQTSKVPSLVPEFTQYSTRTDRNSNYYEVTGWEEATCHQSISNTLANVLNLVAESIPHRIG